MGDPPVACDSLTLKDIRQMLLTFELTLRRPSPFPQNFVGYA
jgi:hypothetical protein